MNEQEIETTRANLSTGAAEGCACCRENAPAFEALLAERATLRSEVGLLNRRLRRAIYLAGVHGCKLGPVELDSRGMAGREEEALREGAARGRTRIEIIGERAWLTVDDD